MTRLARTTIVDSIIAMIDGQIDSYDRVIHAVDSYYDPFDLDPNQLPRFAIIPDPASGIVGFNALSIDFTFRIGIYGHCYAIPGLTLFKSAEILIEYILDLLLNNMETFSASCFSVVTVGSIMNEQFDDVGRLAYISIPLEVSYNRSLA